MQCMCFLQWLMQVTLTFSQSAKCDWWDHVRRCILARDGQPVVLTIDHKPTHPKEELRIKQVRGATQQQNVCLSQLLLAAGQQQANMSAAVACTIQYFGK